MPDCGTELEVIGHKFVRREFHFTPAKGEVVNIYRETARCPACSERTELEENLRFVKAFVPEALIPNSYTSAIAWAMYRKGVFGEANMGKTKTTNLLRLIALLYLKI